MFSENELPDVSLCPQALLHLLCRDPSPLNLPGKGWYFSYFTLRNSCLRYVWTSIAVHSFAILLVSMFKSIKLQAPLTLSCLFFLTLTFIFQGWFYPWVKCGFFAELRAQSHQWSCGLTSQSHQVRSFCTRVGPLPQPFNLYLSPLQRLRPPKSSLNSFRMKDSPLGLHQFGTWS